LGPHKTVIKLANDIKEFVSRMERPLGKLAATTNENIQIFPSQGGSDEATVSALISDKHEALNWLRRAAAQESQIMCSTQLYLTSSVREDSS